MSEHLNLTHLQQKLQSQEEMIKSLEIQLFINEIELGGFIRESPESVENFMNDGYDVEESHQGNLKRFYKTFLK